ncbi:hypothetical protein CDAR_320261 [Caerostris darwini]|uniref:Uncharacterized protein n=1 Tax=Caerostris darwini TaxID=1538125 RepID=A0AAV4PHJ0_9ARAC|nr:hypothetical protein CDAR_320261 [Caerostris darwini]
MPEKQHTDSSGIFPSPVKVLNLLMRQELESALMKTIFPESLLKLAGFPKLKQKPSLASDRTHVITGWLRTRFKWNLGKTLQSNLAGTTRNPSSAFPPMKWQTSTVHLNLHNIPTIITFRVTPADTGSVSKSNSTT